MLSCHGFAPAGDGVPADILSSSSSVSFPRTWKKAIITSIRNATFGEFRPILDL
jgi:hypothetical protein